MDWTIAEGALIFLACAGLAYALVRKSGGLGVPEEPERILGKRIWLGDVRGLGDERVNLPVANVMRCTDGVYTVEFLQPYEGPGGTSRRADISSRDIRHPVSNLGCGVHGVLDTGQHFIAWVRSSDAC